MAKRDIIAIGGSAGSGAVLKRIVGGLPENLEASLFVSTHIPTNSAGYLAEVLANSSALPVTQAIDNQPIERGHIYVAAPDRHLLLIDGTIRLGAGRARIWSGRQSTRCSDRQHYLMGRAQSASC